MSTNIELQEKSAGQAPRRLRISPRVAARLTARAALAHLREDREREDALGRPKPEALETAAAVERDLQAEWREAARTPEAEARVRFSLTEANSWGDAQEGIARLGFDLRSDGPGRLKVTLPGAPEALWRFSKQEVESLSRDFGQSYLQYERELARAAERVNHRVGFDRSRRVTHCISCGDAHLDTIIRGLAEGEERWFSSRDYKICPSCYSINGVLDPKEYARLAALARAAGRIEGTQRSLRKSPEWEQLVSARVHRTVALGDLDGKRFTTPAYSDLATRRTDPGRVGVYRAVETAFDDRGETYTIAGANRVFERSEIEMETAAGRAVYADEVYDGPSEGVRTARSLRPSDFGVDYAFDLSEPAEVDEAFRMNDAFDQQRRARFEAAWDAAGHLETPLKVLHARERLLHNFDPRHLLPTGPAREDFMDAVRDIWNSPGMKQRAKDAAVQQLIHQRLGLHDASGNPFSEAALRENGTVSRHVNPLLPKEPGREYPFGARVSHSGMDESFDPDKAWHDTHARRVEAFLKSKGFSPRDLPSLLTKREIIKIRGGVPYHELVRQMREGPLPETVLAAAETYHQDKATEATLPGSAWENMVANGEVLLQRRSLEATISTLGSEQQQLREVMASVDQARSATESAGRQVAVDLREVFKEPKRVLGALNGTSPARQKSFFEMLGDNPGRIHTSFSMHKPPELSLSVEEAAEQAARSGLTYIEQRTALSDSLTAARDRLSQLRTDGEQDLQSFTPNQILALCQHEIALRTRSILDARDAITALAGASDHQVGRLWASLSKFDRTRVLEVLPAFARHTDALERSATRSVQRGTPALTV